MNFLFWISSLSILMASPLDEYVNSPDSHYSFKEISSRKGPGYTLYRYNMTSLKWKTESVSNHPVWRHVIDITIPDKVIYRDTGLLLIDGGWNDRQDSLEDRAFVAITTTLAVSTGTVCADLKMIPNQPIEFKADPEKKRRTEDSLVAWTWKQYASKNGTDPEIILEFPMTKAVVRGLDTIASVAKEKINININKFFVTGASKRGWITWLTAAVDKRVIGIAPIVMDLLNFVKNLHHHFRSLGGWTFAFEPYYENNFTKHLDSPYTQKMASYIDPLAYNDRYHLISKMVISSAGDEFFLPDDSHYYYDQLSGPKYLRIVPDAEHTLIGHIIDMIFSLRSFYLSILTKTTRPKLVWNREITSSGGRITLYTDTKPKTVQAKFAVTIDNKRRDFRLFVGKPTDSTKKYPHPVLWFSDKVRNIYVNIHRADGSIQEYTTEVQIIPDVFPFPDCHGERCRGSLV